MLDGMWEMPPGVFRRPPEGRPYRIRLFAALFALAALSGCVTASSSFRWRLPDDIPTPRVLAALDAAGRESGFRLCGRGPETLCLERRGLADDESRVLDMAVTGSGGERFLQGRLTFRGKSRSGLAEPTNRILLDLFRESFLAEMEKQGEGFRLR